MVFKQSGLPVRYGNQGVLIQNRVSITGKLISGVKNQ